MHTRRLLIAPAAIAMVLATTAAGCGSSGPTHPDGGYTTSIQIKGAPSTKTCRVVVTLLHPVNKQISATLTVTCNFPVATADVSLVIQGKPIGADATHWDNVDDPVTSHEIPTTLTYVHNCVTGIDYQASASVDALADDGTPVHDTETDGPKYYLAPDCSGS